MAIDTATFRKAHDEVRTRAAALRSVAARLPQLTISEREEARQRLLCHLRDKVDPHAKLDEGLLYPAVAEQLGDPLIAASMNYDHLAIRHWISKIAGVDAADVERLQQLLYGLDALIRVHIWKENELFLASLESSSWPERGC
jgi:hypothetical protein